MNDYFEGKRSDGFGRENLWKMEKRTFSDIINSLHKKGELNYKDKQRLTSDFYRIVEEISSTVVSGKKITIKGLGTLYPYAAKFNQRGGDGMAGIVEPKDGKRRYSIRIRKGDYLKNKFKKYFNGIKYEK